jgi:hypothetical protein
MASKDTKMSKQHTAAKRKHVTLIIPQKLEMIRRLESGETKVLSWLHTTFDCYLCMIQRNRRTNYDDLGHTVKV